MVEFEGYPKESGYFLGDREIDSRGTPQWDDPTHPRADEDGTRSMSHSLLTRRVDEP